MELGNLHEVDETETKSNPGPSARGHSICTVKKRCGQECCKAIRLDLEDCGSGLHGGLTESIYSAQLLGNHSRRRTNQRSSRARILKALAQSLMIMSP